MDKIVQTMYNEIREVLDCWKQDFTGPGIDPLSTTPRAFIHDVMLAMAMAEDQDDDLAATIDKVATEIKESQESIDLGPITQDGSCESAGCQSVGTLFTTRDGRKLCFECVEKAAKARMAA